MGSQPLKGDHSHGWQILATLRPHHTLYKRRKQAPVTLSKSVERRKGERKLL